MTPDTRMYLLEIFKDRSLNEIDDLMDRLPRIENYISTGYYIKKIPEVIQLPPINPPTTNQKKFTEILNERLDNDKTLTDPLQKEYTRHMILEREIYRRFQDKVSKVYKEIDDEMGLTPTPDPFLEKQKELSSLVSNTCSQPIHKVEDSDLSPEDMKAAESYDSKIDGKPITGIPQIFTTPSPLLNDTLKKRLGVSLMEYFGDTVKGLAEATPKSVTRLSEKDEKIKPDIDNNIGKIMKNIAKSLPKLDHGCGDVSKINTRQLLDDVARTVEYFSQKCDACEKPEDEIKEAASNSDLEDYYDKLI